MNDVRECFIQVVIKQILTLEASGQFFFHQILVAGFMHSVIKLNLYINQTLTCFHFHLFIIKKTELKVVM